MKTANIISIIIMAVLLCIFGGLIGLQIGLKNGYESGKIDTLQANYELQIESAPEPADCFSDECADKFLLELIDNATRMEFSFNGTNPGEQTYYIGIYYDSTDLPTFTEIETPEYPEYYFEVPEDYR